MSTASAPLEIGHVVLTANDLAGLTKFYQSALGLEVLSADGTETRLGAGGKTLVALRGDAAARRAGRREAGLFHTAFLMPHRKALARWLIHAAESRLPLQGASDHLVSEAIYLADPEGNGIEVYVDRPRTAWYDAKGAIKMDTIGLDLNDLAAEADGPWTGAPEGEVVGHVHLQVGNVTRAEEFYRDTLGFDVAAHYPGASFLGSGGYHHHIGANIWNSREAGPRNFPVTGLTELILRADAPRLAAIAARAGGTTLADPWGTPVTLLAKGA